MQTEVEEFDFNKFYPKEDRQFLLKYFAQPEPGAKPTLIKEEEETINDCISLNSRAYTHRALNFVVSHYKFAHEDINPYMIFKFDVR